MTIPKIGSSFIAWKKASIYIVKLFIPKDAKRIGFFGSKCRASKATCLDIEFFDGTKADGITMISSNYDPYFLYVISKTVEVSNFDENEEHECAPGIHFFMSRKEALAYV